ncbi:hypothetical protein PRIC2_004390 [Phytophthora ramorum]|uniref:uncharacterized protein n=1 Tax=Phytophthora ramorum TaxID=164328 RepID=UPI0030AA936B|nr:hypothetical protein KRP23_4266 [Phytophthora ramorum]
MHCKADITFLLNPSDQEVNHVEAACASPEHADHESTEASSPSMALFRSLSPVVSSPDSAQTLVAPCMAPREKKRFSSLRCYGSDKTRLPMISMAALCVSSGLTSSSSVGGEDSPSELSPTVEADTWETKDCVSAYAALLTCKKFQLTVLIFSLD